MALINKLSGQLLTKLSANGSSSNAAKTSISTLNGLGVGATFDNNAVELSLGIARLSTAFQSSFKRFNTALHGVNITKDALEKLLKSTDKLIDFAKRASDANASDADRARLNTQFQKEVINIQTILEGTTRSRLDLLSKDDLAELLKASGIDLREATRLAEFFEKVGGKDGILGYERVFSEGVFVRSSKNVGNGTFQARTSYSTGTEPFSVSLSDVNNDGKLDIISADLTANKTSILLGNGNGSFQARTSYSTGTNPGSVTVSDVNGDGKLDIITADYSDNKTSVLLGNGNGSFQARTSYSTGTNPSSVTLGDVNNDGKLDIVIAIRADNKTDVLLGNGNGTFQAKISYATGSAPIYATLGDINGDGKLDIVTADSFSNKTSAFLGNGNGTFQARTSYSTGINTRHATLGDINGDGKLDIITADSTDNKISAFLGNGNGSFQARTSYSTAASPRFTALVDINSDGNQDVVSADRNDNQISVFLGNGNGSFQARISYDTGTQPLSVFLGDVNNDRALDISVASQSANKIDILLANTINSATTEYTEPPSTSNPFLQSLRTQGKATIALNTLKKLRKFIKKDLDGINGVHDEVFGAIRFALAGIRATGKLGNSIDSFTNATDLAQALVLAIKNNVTDNALGAHSDLDRKLAQALLSSR